MGICRFYIPLYTLTLYLGCLPYLVLTQDQLNLHARLSAAHRILLNKYPYAEYLKFSQNFFYDLNPISLPHIGNDIGPLLLDLPVYIIKRNEGTGNLGNRMGEWLWYSGCRYAAGAHLILIPTPELVQEGLRYVKEPFYDNRVKATREIFAESFPPFIINPNPARSAEEAKQKASSICGSLTSTWTRPLNLTLVIPFWRKLLGPIFHNITTTFFNSSLYTPVSFKLLNDSGINPEKLREGAMGGELISRPLRETDAVPMYPDVAIHYRCRDNVFFEHMGLLPFDVIVRRVPSDAKHVIIFTENGNYPSKENELCADLVKILYSKVVEKAPGARVVLRSGFDVFFTYSILMHAQIVVCSASTFCFHAALPNSVGNVHFPVTQFFYGTAGYNMFRKSNAATNPFPRFQMIEEVLPLSFDPKSNITQSEIVHILQNETLCIELYHQSPSVSRLRHEAYETFRWFYHMRR